VHFGHFVSLMCRRNTSTGTFLNFRQGLGSLRMMSILHSKYRA